MRKRERVGTKRLFNHEKELYVLFWRMRFPHVCLCLCVAELDFQKDAHIIALLVFCSYICLQISLLFVRYECEYAAIPTF